jgi:hypothetical protein
MRMPLSTAAHVVHALSYVVLLHRTPVPARCCAISAAPCTPLACYSQLLASIPHQQLQLLPLAATARQFVFINPLQPAASPGSTH